MKVIILAAGNAKRHANKPLLPISKDKILIESAIDFARGYTPATLNVVVSPSSTIAHVLRVRGHDDVEFVVQPESYGVPDAIARGALAGMSDPVNLVLFSDNLYSPEMRSANNINDVMTTMVFNKSNDAKKIGLDYWHDAKSAWCLRPMSTDDKLATSRPQYAAGYIVLQHRHAVHGRHDESLVAFLNRMGIMPMEIEGQDDWFDLGTPDAYLNYLKKQVHVVL